MCDQIPLSDSELLRYSRQIMMPEFDITGQLALKGAAALVVGAGGLGSSAAMYLAAAGIGSLTIYDDDNVSLSNLQRQILHNTADIDRKKTESARKTLNALNPHCEVTIRNCRLNENELLSLQGKIAVAVDCSDNFSTRILLNRVCFQMKIPMVFASAGGFNGQLSVFDYQAHTPCYTCLFPDITTESDKKQLSCSETGILSPITGIIGSMQALEAIKIISTVGEPATGRLICFDGISLKWKALIIKKNPDCFVCAN